METQLLQFARSSLISRKKKNPQTELSSEIIVLVCCRPHCNTVKAVRSVSSSSSCSRSVARSDSDRHPNKRDCGYQVGYLRHCHDCVIIVTFQLSPMRTGFIYVHGYPSQYEPKPGEQQLKITLCRPRRRKYVRSTFDGLSPCARCQLSCGNWTRLPYF